MSEFKLKQSPNLVQQHKLILTQELQLFLKLIQMNTLELKDYLEEQLVENPTLEETQEEPSEKSSEDTELEEFENNLLNKIKSQDNNDYPHSREFFSDLEEDNPWENRITKPESLLEHLNWQLKMSDLDDKDTEIASLIIGNINEDGYLETSLNELTDKLLRSNSDIYLDKKSYENNFELFSKKIKKVLNIIQTTFDPVGIGCTSLAECLRIQAIDLGYGENSDIVKIINDHLEDISNNNYVKISEELNLSEEEIINIEQIISSFEPKPGRPYFSKDTHKYIIPDFYIYRVGNELQLQFNRSFPRLRISMYYRNLIKKHKTLPKDTRLYLKEKIESAQRILKCLEERETTIRKVLTEILRVQKDFFEHGKNYIKPLRLKDVAEVVGVHESTVSRITSKRYIQCPQGVIELKTLFSRGVDTSSGKQLSFERVKTMIKDIINSESDGCAFSDEDISKILLRKNVKVARRTVAKYRKILGIPTSSKRLNKEG